MDDDLDRLLRLTAFTWLDDLVRRHGEAVPRSVLEAGFPFQRQMVKVIGPQGIFVPKGMQIPLSITTAPEKPGVRRPYEDEVGADGLLRYKYRGTDAQHRENVGLRQAWTDQVPLVWFFGLIPGLYQPVYPVVITTDDPATLTFTIAIEPTDAFGPEPLRGVSTDVRRAYATQEVRRRLHQARFREKVLAAYRCSCAICQLRHGELLDAAHILPDGHPRGEPVVPNGLSLCKIHHAAFDRDMIGVRPDLILEVRQAIRDEKDGPMLLHGLQECHGRSLTIPRRRADRPDAEFLEERYELFRRAG